MCNYKAGLLLPTKYKMSKTEIKICCSSWYLTPTNPAPGATLCWAGKETLLL